MWGKGKQAMTGGNFHTPAFTRLVARGRVRRDGPRVRCALGMRKQLEAITDPEQRERIFQQMVAVAYERGKAISMASCRPTTYIRPEPLLVQKIRRKFSNRDRDLDVVRDAAVEEVEVRE
jgi:acetyl-CoA carboxylase carboxyltransferase component